MKIDRSNVEVENRMKNGCIALAFEQQPETIAIQEAVKVLLQGLGEDIHREGIKKTPFRVAKALREGTRGYKQKVKDFVESALFPETGLDDGQAGGVGGLVVVRDLDHYSYCESCLLPFQVKCHIGYVPSGQRVLGLSKLLPFYGVVHIGYFCADDVSKPIERSLVESIVQFYGFKLQVQERMTRQVAETLSPQVGGDIIVVAEAEPNSQSP